MMIHVSIDKVEFQRDASFTVNSCGTALNPDRGRLVPAPYYCPCARWSTRLCARSCCVRGPVFKEPTC